MGDAPEGTAEAAPASDVADAKTATAVPDALDTLAVPAGTVSASRAAQMLMGGGRGGAIPPNARARLTPGAALALQRTIGNRALSRRMLMRDESTKTSSPDDVEELPVPYIVDAAGPNEAASRASDFLSSTTDTTITLVVLDAKRVYVYDKDAKPQGTVDLVVPTAWTRGVWVAQKPSPEFVPVGYWKGEIFWDRDIVHGGPTGKLLGKPAQNATPVAPPPPKPDDKKPPPKDEDPLKSFNRPPKPRFAGLDALVADPEALKRLMTGDVTFLVIPYYTGGKKAGGGKDGASGSDTAGLSGKDKGEPPNAPAYPSYLTGNDQAATGSYSMYTMELVQGDNSIDAALAAMTWVDYTWERWDLGNTSRDSLQATLKTAAIASAKKDPSRESGVFEATGRHWSDDAKQQKEDYENAWKAKAVRGQSKWSAIKDFLSNEVSLQLAPFSWIVSAGGNMIDTVSTARPQRRVEKEMAWPTKPGLYVIRCIAQVGAMVDGKNPDGSDNIVRHAPSVATMLVEVKDPQAIANEAADKAELDLLKAQLALQDALDHQKSEKEIAQLRAATEAARIQARGSSVDVLLAAVKALTDKKNALDEADYLRRNAVDEQIDDLRKAIDVIGQRAYKVDPTGKTKAIRLNASFVSSKGGQPSSLILDLYECPDSVAGAYHYKLSDVTTKDSPAFPEATDPDRKQAIISTLEQYRTHSGLGPGYLAVRIPGELVGEKDPVPWHGRTAEQGWGQAKQHINDALLIASIIATAFAGPEAMIIIGAIGGAAAAINIIDRVQTGNFRIDDPQSIQDIIAVIGAVAPGVQALGKLAILRLGEYSMFAAGIGDLEAAQRAATAIKITQRSVAAFERANDLLGKVGMFIATEETIHEFQKIRQQERDGEISHNEAERRRLSAFSSAATNLGLYVVQHAAAQPHVEDPAAALKQQSESNQRVAKMIEEHQATEATKRTLEELKTAQAAVDKAIADLNANKPSEEELKRRQDELAAKDAELAKKFAELERLEAARQAAGGGGKKPPESGVVHGEGPPSSGPKKPPTRAEASDAFKRAIAGTGDPRAAAHDLIKTMGDWKSGLKKVLGEIPDGPLRRAAEQELVAARDQIVDDAWKAVGGDGDLRRLNVGTKAFGSDIDITVRPTDEAIAAAGGDVSKLIEQATERAAKFKEALRQGVSGHETDAAIDTNVYSYIGEGALGPRTAAERAANVEYQQMTGLAEALRGGGKAGFADLLAQARARAQGDPVAIKHLNELAVEAKKFVEARAAEERSARNDLRSEGSKPGPAEDRAVRDRIVEGKKKALADAAAEKPQDRGKILRLQSEILWFEPDAYTTRAAIEQTVGQTQAKRAAGATITPEEAVSGARTAFEEAKKSGTTQDVEKARNALDAAIADRDAIADAQAKLDAAKAERVGDDHKAQVDQAHKIRAAEQALEAAQRQFRSRMVFEGVEAVEGQSAAKDYTPQERRTASAAIATSQLGMMEGHVRGAHDPGSKVKYVCKYGARILEAIMLAGVSYKGSVAASSLIDMFTQSRWTFNEGPAGMGMVRDMLIHYAEATGKPVNIEEGRKVGVPSEVQQAFVNDILSYMRGATAKMTDESLQKGELRSVLQEARIAVDAADQHGGDAKMRDEAIRKAVADKLASEMGSAKTTVENKDTGETHEAPYTSETDLGRQLQDMPSGGMLPKAFQEARANLEGATDADSKAIREALPAIVKGLRTPRFYAEVMADAAALARERGISTNEALIELAKRTGIKVTEVGPGSFPLGKFYEMIATRPEYFIDNDIDSEHGHMTHLLQDLAVNKALDEAGIKERAPQLRGRLKRLPGRAGNNTTGDTIWKATWDDENPRDFGTPEMLKSVLGKYGVG